MKNREIGAVAASRLRSGYSVSVSFGFFLLALYTFILAFSALLADFLLKIPFLSERFSEGWAEMGVGIFLTLILLAPVRLGIKKWYLLLQGDFLPSRQAFAFLKGKGYWKTFLFSVVRQITAFLLFLLPLLPSVVIAAALRAAFEGGSGDALFGVLLIFLFCLTLLGIVIALYGYLGLFFADYIFLRRITDNPFRAVVLSFRIAGGRRGKLCRLVLRMLPYFIISLLGVVFPFAVPKIQSALAVYAEDAIDSYTGGMTCQF